MALGGLCRSSNRYRHRDGGPLRAKLHELAGKRRCWGYRRPLDLLDRDDAQTRTKTSSASAACTPPKSCRASAQVQANRGGRANSEDSCHLAESAVVDPV